MCSKLCRYLFTDLICYSCSDLLIAAFSVCRGFVIVVVLWLFVWTNYGWSSWEYTGLFRCLLIIYWFLSSLFAICVCLCVHKGMFVKDRWQCVAVSMCWKWVDLIYTGLFARQKREVGASCIGCLSVSFLFHSLCFLKYVCVILSLLFSISFVSCSPSVFHCLLSFHYNPLSSSANHWLYPPIHSQFLWLVSIILSIAISPTFTPSPL